MDNNTNNIDNSNVTNNAPNGGIDPTMLNSIKIPVSAPVPADNPVSPAAPVVADTSVPAAVPVVANNTVPAAVPVANTNPVSPAVSVETPTTPVVSQVTNSTSLATSVVSDNVTSNLSNVDLEASNFGIDETPNTAPQTTNNMATNSNNVFATRYKVGFCPRCGAEFNPKERYCNKCGNINPKHPDNANMLKYIKKYGGQGYRIGSGQALVRKKGVFGRGRNSDIVMGQKTGNASICFAVNIVLYLVLTIGTTLYYFLLARGNIVNVVGSNITLYYLVYSAIFLYLYSIQLLFIKLNRKWWLSLIPLVNMQ